MPSSKTPAPPTIALLDSAFALLREVPAQAWLWWAAGALPYALSLLTLIAEMSSTAQLRDRLASRALVTAVAYLWMAATNALFCLSLRRILSGHTASPGGPSLIAVAATQALLQSTALLVLPVAVLSAIAAPWAFAFYESASAYPYSHSAAPVRLRDVYRYALKEASRWPLANVVTQLVVAPFSLIVLVNTMVIVVGGPFVFRTLTGQESDFTRSPMAMLNLTVFSAGFLVAWLFLSPFLKAIYTIRCFQGDSTVTAADLRADLRRLASRLVTAAAFAAFIPKVVAQSNSVDPPQLERAIREVTSRPEYVWRTPQLVTPEISNPFIRFTEDAVRVIAGVVTAIARFLARVIEIVVRWVFGKGGAPAGDPPPGDSATIETVMIGMLIVAGLAVAVFLVRQLRARRRVPAPAAVVQTPAVVDITSDDVSPDQLPDSGWLDLADQWIARGDLRMATRAVFLALLAALGAQGAISIGRAKSNLDYSRELRRRARGNAPLHDSFRSCVSAFERTWYGRHEMSPDLFARFRSDALTTRSHAQQA